MLVCVREMLQNLDALVMVIFQGVYLESRLLGVLAFFDAQLVNSNTAVADKKLVSFNAMVKYYKHCFVLQDMCYFYCSIHYHEVFLGNLSWRCVMLMTVNFDTQLCWCSSFVCLQLCCFLTR